MTMWSKRKRKRVVEWFYGEPISCYCKWVSIACVQLHVGEVWRGVCVVVVVVHVWDVWWWWSYVMVEVYVVMVW